MECETIDEEPEFLSSLRSSPNSHVSQYSITVDDDSTLEVAPDNSRHRSASQQSQVGVVSAIRRLTLSRFLFQSDQTDDGLPPPPPPPPGRRGAWDGANHQFRNNVRNRENRRATIFTRQQRRSLGTARSSMTSSGGSDRPPHDAYRGRDQEEATHCLSDAKVRALRRVIDNWAWTGITLFFILVILFGPPIQDLWLPKEMDGFMDGILTLGFFVLAFDIVIRSVVDKSYFALNRRRGVATWFPRLCACKFLACLHAGSSMFWFDTIALLTIGHRISYINPEMRTPFRVSVALNVLGFPSAGHHATPMSIDWPLILTVGRVGLMARFIRTSVLTQVSSSWMLMQYFHPEYWMSKCERRRIEKENEVLDSEKVLVSSSQARPDENLDLNSVSSLGDSTGMNVASGGRRALGERLTMLSSFPEKSESPPPEEESNVKRIFKAFAKKPSDAGADASDGAAPNRQKESMLLGNDDSRSHVGAAMRELTGQRIAMGALLALIMTVVCDWHEQDTTKVLTMLTLHGQTANPKFANMSVEVARSRVIPSLYNYTRANGSDAIFSSEYGNVVDLLEHLRDREILSVNITMNGSDEYSHGLFDNSQILKDNAKVELVTTVLILFIWILGVASFAGPVMTLVVEPIERMVRLLSMLMKDPLGYQTTPQYKKLKREGDEIADKYKSMWSKEVLKGMETNFLMSTILRIGSLMRVGFGTAGVEIIRNNLERGQHKDVLFLNKQGSSVSCIFLFCDIRQFTDATECLQEEVFVFTNKIAAVVHSICNSYGGSANKNIGDAFLVSWLLDETPAKKEGDDDPFKVSSRNLTLGKSQLCARNNQADKALLSVVKISMALHYDNYFVDGMKKGPKEKLLTKLSKRKGPIVQMGFGLNAGKAVQGAIGSQRKLDVTYISESVERAEFLESSTKKYGVPLLMSESFYNLLDPLTRNRCRKVDQLLMVTEETCEDLSDPHELLDSGEKMDIYTYDMDIEALWRPSAADDDNSEINSDICDILQDIAIQQKRSTIGPGTSVNRRSTLARRASFVLGREANPLSVPRNIGHRRASLFIPAKDAHKTDIEKAIQALAEDITEKPDVSKTLVLPTGARQYNDRSWRESDIKKIRHSYVANGIIFPKYQDGLKSYCAKDWEHAQQCFEFVLKQREDGPSQCFLTRIAEHGGNPPRNFIGYTRSDEL